MAANKTRANKQSVIEFLNSVTDEQKRKDSFEVLDIMREITGKEPVMWGPSIVGFGTYHYKYESGREGDFLVTGFSPRKQNLTIYIMTGFDKEKDLMNKLGNFKTGKSCLYVKKLADIDESLLRSLITNSIRYLNTIYASDVML